MMNLLIRVAIPVAIVVIVDSYNKHFYPSVVIEMIALFLMSFSFRMRGE